MLEPLFYLNNSMMSFHHLLYCRYLKHSTINVYWSLDTVWDDFGKKWQTPTVQPFIMQQKLLELRSFPWQYEPFKKITLNLVSVRTPLFLAMTLIKLVHGLVYSINSPYPLGFTVVPHFNRSNLLWLRTSAVRFRIWFFSILQWEETALFLGFIMLCEVHRMHSSLIANKLNFWGVSMWFSRTMLKNIHVVVLHATSNIVFNSLKRSWSFCFNLAD